VNEGDMNKRASAPPSPRRDMLALTKTLYPMAPPLGHFFSVLDPVFRFVRMRVPKRQWQRQRPSASVKIRRNRPQRKPD